VANKTPGNRGWFRKGHDPRRHSLTQEERRRGGETWKRLYCLCDVRSTYFHASRDRIKELRAAEDAALAEADQAVPIDVDALPY